MQIEPGVNLTLLLTFINCLTPLSLGILIYHMEIITPTSLHHLIGVTTTIIYEIILR